MTSYSSAASISLKIQLPSDVKAPDLYFPFFSSNDREQWPAGGSEKEFPLCSLHKDCTLNLHKLPWSETLSSTTVEPLAVKIIWIPQWLKVITLKMVKETFPLSLPFSTMFPLLQQLWRLWKLMTFL